MEKQHKVQDEGQARAPAPEGVDGVAGENRGGNLTKERTVRGREPGMGTPASPRGAIRSSD